MGLLLTNLQFLDQLSTTNRPGASNNLDLSSASDKSKPYLQAANVEPPSKSDNRNLSSEADNLAPNLLMSPSLNLEDGPLTLSELINILSSDTDSDSSSKPNISDSHPASDKPKLLLEMPDADQLSKSNNRDLPSKLDRDSSSNVDNPTSNLATSNSQLEKRLMTLHESENPDYDSSSEIDSADSFSESYESDSPSESDDSDSSLELDRSKSSPELDNSGSSSGSDTANSSSVSNDSEPSQDADNSNATPKVDNFELYSKLDNANSFTKYRQLRQMPKQSK